MGEVAVSGQLSYIPVISDDEEVTPGPSASRTKNTVMRAPHRGHAKMEEKAPITPTPKITVSRTPAPVPAPIRREIPPSSTRRTRRLPARFCD